MQALRHPRQLHYAWIMAAVTFVVLLGASGFRSARSVLIVPLQEDFDWSRATFSIAISINLLLFGFIGPFPAALMERFGIRIVVTSALVIIATVASRWFVARRGVVVGVLTAANATGQLIFLPLFPGWRRTRSGDRSRSRPRSRPYRSFP